MSTNSKLDEVLRLLRRRSGRDMIKWLVIGGIAILVVLIGTGIIPFNLFNFAF